jgi:hypothetical protein
MNRRVLRHRGAVLAAVVLLAAACVGDYRLVELSDGDLREGAAGVGAMSQSPGGGTAGTSGGNGASGKSDSRGTAGDPGGSAGDPGGSAGDPGEQPCGREALCPNAPVRVVGTIVTQANTPAVGKLQLVEHGFEALPPACGAARCVMGRFQP